MSGERRVLNDVGGVLANIVDGSHDVSRQLEGLPHALVVLANGVPVDVLTAGHNPPRRGIGTLREAKAHAVRWAVETAVATTIEADPPGRRGPVQLPVARPAALVAKKAVSTAEPARGEKRASDLLDIWRLLSDNPVRTAQLLSQRREAPERLQVYTRQRLHDLFVAGPGDFVRDMAAGPGGAAEVREGRELYDGLIQPDVTEQSFGARLDVGGPL